jgi:hypothetical protein
MIALQQTLMRSTSEAMNRQIPLGAVQSHQQSTSRRQFVRWLAGAAAAAIAPRRLAASEHQPHTSGADSTISRVGKDGIIFFPKMHRSDVMKGFPPPPGKQVTLDNWAHSSTGHWRWSHLNPDMVFKTVQIEKDTAPIWQLPRSTIAPGTLLQARVLWGHTRNEAREIPIAEWFERADIDALVVLRKGRIVAELYAGEMTARTRHMIWCASKSFLATLLAPLLVDGTLEEGAELTRYVPEFSETVVPSLALSRRKRYRRNDSIASNACQPAFDCTDGFVAFGEPP